MSCDKQELIFKLVENLLTVEQKEEAELHLNECDECKEIYNEFISLNEQLSFEKEEMRKETYDIKPFEVEKDNIIKFRFKYVAIFLVIILGSFLTYRFFEKNKKEKVNNYYAKVFENEEFANELENAFFNNESEFEDEKELDEFEQLFDELEKLDENETDV